ncbi:MAG: translocation/assembly module TamB domain-containing protein, partial [Sphingomonas bacterium]|nr:translocation/assembly module TamB domain-containing protein [Sphingomonas bacterium]
MALWVAGAIVALLAIIGAALIVVDTDTGHRWVADRIGTIRTANGLRFTVGRIDGSLYSDTRLVDLNVYDLDGLVFAAPTVALDWSPFNWARNRLDIDRLAVPTATLFHQPRTKKSAKRGAILPDFDIHIGSLSIERLVLAKPVLGTQRIARLIGAADIRSGRAMVKIDGLVEGSDRIHLAIDAEPDRDRFDIDVAAKGARGGLLSTMTGIARDLDLAVTGDGRWARWRGTAKAVAGTEQALDVALAADAGRYTLSGTIAPAPYLKGKLQRMTTPRVLVNGSATYANRRLDGTLALRSAALNVETTGEIDFAANAYRNVRIKARLLRPASLFPNMSGRDIELRAILDGAFATAAFDYRIDAARFAFDKTGFENAHLVGKGRLSKSPVIVPARFVAARVTGVGDIAGGILRNISVEGVLRVTPTMLTGDDLRLKSDKLTGRINLTLDLRTGKFEVGVNGALGRYLIPGLGIVDVTSQLRVVPGPGGKGTRVVGEGRAQMVRLDNAFFRSLAGGLPRITAGLERTPDGILHLSNLVLTAPDIALRGIGYRRRDGTFHFEGGGNQRTYGPLTLVLDGRIEKPMLDLVFAAPNDTLGLNDVRAHLDPTPAGFAFRAAGGSRLGAFTALGSILLPPGQSATIAVDRIDVAGTEANGKLVVADGGFDGRLAVAGGGVTGELLFRPVGTVQRIEGHLDARRAGYAQTTLTRGHLDFVTMLDPAGTSVEATAMGQGLRRGRLSVARFAGTASLRGGVGDVRASISGSRGRAFDIQTVTHVTPDSYTIEAQGTLDKRALKLLTPAVLKREGDGWRLAPTRLSFSGGEAEVGGRFATGQTDITAALTQMPLTILDIGYPGLGLGGTASGKLNYATRAGQAPTGRIDMTVRGLSRAGLVLTSRPVDVGVAGVLSANQLGIRAIAASDGKTIGRAQALLKPLGSGDLVTRIRAAPIFAQLRYVGAADTLWRLTGIEFFDLSGPVSIGADVRGRVADPRITGVVQANGARIESATTGTVLTNVQATGRFGGSQLRIDRFAADAGKGGRVTGAGAFDFAAKNGVGLDLRVSAENAVMINRDDIGATVTGPLTFTSDGSGGRITGDVTLNQSRYRLGQATAASAVPQLNIREINLPDGGEEDDRPTSPWTMAIKARAPGRVIVSGLGLSSEWSADLDIAGQPDNPAITGRATLIRGDYEFAGREFQLERGIIRFNGETPANPALDIAANADTTGLSASIRVTGNAVKP